MKNLKKMLAWVIALVLLFPISFGIFCLYNYVCFEVKFREYEKLPNRNTRQELLSMKNTKCKEIQIMKAIDYFLNLDYYGMDIQQLPQEFYEKVKYLRENKETALYISNLMGREFECSFSIMTGLPFKSEEFYMCSDLPLLIIGPEKLDCCMRLIDEHFQPQEKHGRNYLEPNYLVVFMVYWGEKVVPYCRKYLASRKCKLTLRELFETYICAHALGEIGSIKGRKLMLALLKSQKRYYSEEDAIRRLFWICECIAKTLEPPPKSGVDNFACAYAIFKKYVVDCAYYDINFEPGDIESWSDKIKQLEQN